jgi:hypothetical protein
MNGVGSIMLTSGGIATLLVDFQLPIQSIAPTQYPKPQNGIAIATRSMIQLPSTIQLAWTLIANTTLILETCLMSFAPKI